MKAFVLLIGVLGIAAGFYVMGTGGAGIAALVTFLLLWAVS